MERYESLSNRAYIFHNGGRDIMYEKIIESRREELQKNVEKIKKLEEKRMIEEQKMRAYLNHRKGALRNTSGLGNLK